MTTLTRRRQLSLGALVCAAVLTLAACGGGATDPASGDAAVGAAGEGTVDAAAAEALGGEEAVAEMQALYAAATESGRTSVTIYGPGERDKEPLYAMFAQRFPGIDVTGVYLLGPEFDGRIQAEFASGQHVADMVQAGDTSVTAHIDQGRYAEFRPVTAEELDPGFSDEGGHAAAASGSAFGIAYNTNLLPAEQAPKGWNDLLDPAYTGMMTSDETTKFGGAFGTLSHLIWDERYDDAFLEGLAGQQIAPQASAPVAGNAVAAGQHAINPFYPYSFFLRDSEQGAPVEFVFPTEGGVHISPHYLALIEGAPNPDAAKLLITWLFTPEAQQAAGEVGYFPLMPGSSAPGGYPSVDELDLLKHFPLADVGDITSSNLARVQAAWGAAG
ncbi:MULTISPECIES: ABC transporter substrate-binding protein [Pseudonocardia]|uniref:Bacterial extracellular solute-binding protein n=2 Tax=Pseudonocardia TaxID=1847 RepID=A0A1Y2MYW9_PSEAH|nr:MULTISPECIES: extracellular solute-binding protein [Pseudonocardia]OSY40370.1 Bacterial extracellular solute-binding protein [Pseudonocardia autotrophica]TDN72299.1 ABC-type Fe3+ transport system substrate-binding protein [Pseudonocardia autotrophica]BBG03011.1 ABC transporter substrate-binding protein [Pseudonocardia autotrophica]GEC25087.1 ABC transporter substrate-binding protein [Pseudonocardia saturnea]